MHRVSGQGCTTASGQKEAYMKPAQMPAVALCNARCCIAQGNSWHQHSGQVCARVVTL
jgi:hypothetical protein